TNQIVNGGSPSTSCFYVNPPADRYFDGTVSFLGSTTCTPTVPSVTPTVAATCQLAKPGACQQSGQVCVPSPLANLGARCILLDASDACPAPYTQERRVFDGVASSCACACGAGTDDCGS